MKKNIILLTTGITLSWLASGQETGRGYSHVVSKRIVKFSDIIEYDITHPVSSVKKNPANTEEEDERKDLPVNEAEVKPFSGKEIFLNGKEAPDPSVITSLSACNNFRALDDDGTSIPPDTHGAVGFDHIMTALNTQVRIQDKQGNTISTVSLVNFWGGLGGHTDIFDPKITYDPYRQRWVIVCCASRDSPGSALLLAVSQTHDPRGNWYLYDIDADPANMLWFDYPSLGFNNNWIVVGGNMFDITGDPTATPVGRLFVIDRGAAYNGTLGGFTFFDRTDYKIIVPSITYSTTENTMWCVSVHNANSNNNGFVRLFSITGTVNSPVFNPTNIVNIGSAWSGTTVGAPQQGSANTIDLGDDRIRSAVVRNGKIWFCGNVFMPANNPTTAGVRYAAITLSNATTFETSTVSNNTGVVMYGYPSICVNQSDEFIMGFTVFKTTAFPAAAVLLNPLIIEYKTGEDWYVKIDATSGKNRWGDYSAACIDPEDDKTMWTIQEYARPRVGANSFWGTWWNKTCNTTCPANLTFSAPVNPGTFQKHEVTNTITSSAIISAGAFIKYDAGFRVTLLPGFKALLGSNLKVYADGCGGIK